MSIDRVRIAELLAAADTDPAALAELVPSLLAEIDRLEDVVEADGWRRVWAEMEAGLWDIRTRAEKATKGPWHRVGTSIRADVLISHDGAPSTSWNNTVVCSVGAWASGRPTEDDAEFIAHARTDVPKLLDALAAASKRIGELEAELAEAHAALALFGSGGAS